MATGEWSTFEARRDDGAPAQFRIRDLAPRLEQSRIFVVEIPYPVIGLSRMPDAAAYRRLAAFEEQWLAPAASALDWTFVAAKIEDGSFFLYLYGNADPNGMIERLSPFDASLGFFDEHDPTWDEYAALRELLDQANALPPEIDLSDLSDERAPATEPPRAKPKAKARAPKAKAKAKTTKITRPAAKAKPKAKAKAKATPKKKPAKKRS